MWEKILIAVILALFEKAGSWITKYYERKKAEGVEHERIGNTVGRLIDAETPEEIRSAFDNLA